MSCVSLSSGECTKPVEPRDVEIWQSHEEGKDQNDGGGLIYDVTNCASFTEPNRNTADYSLTPPSFSGSSFLLLEMEREELGFHHINYVNVD